MSVIDKTKHNEIEKVDNLINAVLTSCDNLRLAVVQVVDCNQDVQNIPSETEQRLQIINEQILQKIMNNYGMKSNACFGKNRSESGKKSTTKIDEPKSTSKQQCVKRSPSEEKVLWAKVTKNEGLDHWRYPNKVQTEKQQGSHESKSTVLPISTSNIGQVTQKTPHLRKGPRRKRKGGAQAGSKSKTKSESKVYTSKVDKKPYKISHTSKKYENMHKIATQNIPEIKISEPARKSQEQFLQFKPDSEKSNKSLKFNNNKFGSLSKSGITAYPGTEVSNIEKLLNHKIIKNYSKESSSSIQKSVESYSQPLMTNLLFPKTISFATVASTKEDISYLKVFKVSNVPSFNYGNSKIVSVCKEVHKWDDTRDNVELLNQFPSQLTLNNYEDKFVIINVENVNQTNSSTIDKPSSLINRNSYANLYEDEIATAHCSENSTSPFEPKPKSEESTKNSPSRKSRMKFGRTVNMISSAIRDFYDVSNVEPDLFKVRKSQDQSHESKISLESNFSNISQEDDESFKIFKILNGSNKPASMFGSIVRVLEPTTCHPGSIVIEQPLLTPSVTLKSSKSDSDRLGRNPFSRSHSYTDNVQCNSSKSTSTSTQNLIKDYNGTIDNQIDASANFGFDVRPGAEFNIGSFVDIKYNQSSPAGKSTKWISLPVLDINLDNFDDQPAAYSSSLIEAKKFTNSKDINADAAAIIKLNNEENVSANSKTAEAETLGQNMGFSATLEKDRDSHQVYDNARPKEYMPKQSNSQMESKKRNCKIVAEWRKSSNKGLRKKAKSSVSSNVAKASYVSSNDESVLAKNKKTSKTHKASSQCDVSTGNEPNMPTIGLSTFNFCNMLKPSTGCNESYKFLDTPEFHISNTITKQSRFKFYISTTVDIIEKRPFNIPSKCHNFEYTVDTFPRDGPPASPALVVKMKKCKNV